MLRMDFTSQDYLRDPTAGITRLRATGPIVEIRFPIVGKTWITTTSDLASRILKDSETFTMRNNGKVAGLRWWMPGWLRTLAVSMLTMDEPDHTRLRSIVDEVFRRRAILDMEPKIFALADELAASCSPTEVQLISLSAMRGSCRCRSSASCWVCQAPTGPGSSLGQTGSRASRAWPASSACLRVLGR